MRGTAHFPPELAERLRLIFGLDEAPAGVEDVLRIFRGVVASVGAESLCCSASRHQVLTGGRTVHTNCVMDALMLPFVTGEAVEVRSRSPLSDEVVTLRATTERVEAEPPSAVVSFGASRVASAPVVAAVCPYINAFPTVEEYERRTADTPDAVTIAMLVGEAFELTRALFTA